MKRREDEVLRKQQEAENSRLEKIRLRQERRTKREELRIARLQ